MTILRERVARIIREGIGLDLPECDQIADAAISCVLAALKEPSEAMVRAGRLENGYVITDIVRTKQEMSDEILSIRYRAMLAAFTRDLETPGEG